jgi:Flp pilus assembly protein TadD
MLALVLPPLLATACVSSEAQRNRELRRDMLGQLVVRHDWSTAFPVARQLLEEQPDDALTLAYRGTIYREQFMYEEAEADLKKALRLDDRLAYAHSSLAVLYDVQERGAEAEQHHRRAVELEPQNTAYLNNLGFSLYVRGKPRLAIPIFKEALRIDPTNPRLQNNLGFAFAAAGDFPRAQQQFQLAGNPAEAKNNLGFAHERQDSLNQAFDLYVEALRLDPTLGRARRNLAHVAGRLQRAIPEDLQQLAPQASSRGE